MTKEKKEITIVCVLLLVLVFSVWSGFSRQKKPKKDLLQPSAPLATIPAGSETLNFPKVDTNVLELQKKRADNPWGRDPFSSDFYKSGQLNSELKLQGISFRKDNVGFAFINNEIVKIGDKIKDYEIAEVLKDKVLLKKGSQSFYLTFPEE